MQTDNARPGSQAGGLSSSRVMNNRKTTKPATALQDQDASLESHPCSTRVPSRRNHSGHGLVRKTISESVRKRTRRNSSRAVAARNFPPAAWGETEPVHSRVYMWSLTMCSAKNPGRRSKNETADVRTSGFATLGSRPSLGSGIGAIFCPTRKPFANGCRNSPGIRPES